MGVGTKMDIRFSAKIGYASCKTCPSLCIAVLHFQSTPGSAPLWNISPVLLLTALHCTVGTSERYTAWSNKNETTLVRPTAANIQDKIKHFTKNVLRLYKNKDWAAISMQLFKNLCKLAHSYNTQKWAMPTMGCY